MSWLRPYQPPSSRELSGRSSGGTRSATSHLSQASSRQTSLRTRSQGLGELFRTKGAVHQSLMHSWASSVGQGLQQGADFLPTRKQPTQWVAALCDAEASSTPLFVCEAPKAHSCIPAYACCTGSGRLLAELMTCQEL